jgi:hypothetical protein
MKGSEVQALAWKGANYDANERHIINLVFKGLESYAV